MSSHRDLFEADNACLWHPFTPMRQWLADPVEDGRIIVAGEGFELIDSKGGRFIDGFSSLWCNLHGHRVGAIDDAVRAQLDRIAHSTLLGHSSQASIELAARLVKIAPPGLAKVFYSDSGATAVEVALKMAYQYWRNVGQPARRRFLALREGYHGDTVGAVSLGGIDTFHRIFRPLLFEAAFVESPCAYHHPAGPDAAQAVLAQIDAALAAAPDEYAAIIVEPLVQGAGGMLTHPRGFLAGVADLAGRHDVLLIVDEVATGFCRTGALFACQQEHVAPDLMCIGKGLTGGYLPVAATLATQKIFDAFCGDIAEGKTFYHGHTFTGNALGCAAAVASIDLIFQSRLLDSLPAKVDQVRRRLAELADHPHVGDIRQCGLMVGIELVADRRGPVRFDPLARTGAAVCAAARKRGVIIRPLGDVIVLMPAPAMDTATLDRLLSTVIETIHEFFLARAAPSAPPGAMLPHPFAEACPSDSPAPNDPGRQVAPPPSAPSQAAADPDAAGLSVSLGHASGKKTPEAWHPIHAPGSQGPRYPVIRPAAGLFVTGTDTGVGKTLIAGAIARLLRETAGGVEVFKPVATGCRSVEGRLVSEDGEFLAACAASARTHEEIVPVRFADPLAPNVAAARAGTRVDVDAILAAYAALARSGLPVVVEGVGGLLCPISDDVWVIHLARLLQLPLLIVARAGLGTINHTLLTLHAARAAGLTVAGVILNGHDQASADPSLPSNPAQIESLGRVKVLAQVPHDPHTSVQSATLGPAVLAALRPVDWSSLSSPR